MSTAFQPQVDRAPERSVTARRFAPLVIFTANARIVAGAAKRFGGWLGRVWQRLTRWSRPISVRVRMWTEPVSGMITPLGWGVLTTAVVTVVGGLWLGWASSSRSG